MWARNSEVCLSEATGESGLESGTSDFQQLHIEEDNASKKFSPWQTKFKGSTSQYFGYVDSIEAAMKVMKEYELETTTKFSSFKSDSKFEAGGN